ncbi:Long chain base biosynthesis protein 1b [Camellia lanceoleosa]|uniref:Long chain base biosynthesis protein 1b n=1 Tax=Camellia lanceoleosa TaxID=1840588 RepID=A0ACC0IBH9_9ERIC|nr:Long chain base biosynthesis protein 1b [Camellia lanceoleosa]
MLSKPYSTVRDVGFYPICDLFENELGLCSSSKLYGHVLKEDSVFVVTSKRSTLDKCHLPVGVRLFVSAAHSESDLLKASESLKRVAASVLAAHG